MTAMFATFWQHVRNISLEEKSRCKVLFLSHACKLNQQKQRDNVSKIAAKIFLSNKYDLFPICLLLTNHKHFTL